MLPPGFRQDLDDAEAITPLSALALADVMSTLRNGLGGYGRRPAERAIAGRGAKTLMEAMEAERCGTSSLCERLEPDSWVIIQARGLGGFMCSRGYHGTEVQKQLQEIPLVPA